MSFKPMIWAWEVDGLTPPTKLVLMSLANHANDHGTSCHPSVDRIAKEACLSVRSVQYALKWLETEGYIKVFPRTRDTHQFRLLMNLKVEATKVQNLHPQNDATVQDLQARVQNPSFEGATSAPEPRIEPRKEPRTLFADESIEESGGKASAACTADDLIDTWNRHCAGVRKITRCPPARRKLIQNAFKSEFDSDPVKWERFCKRVARAPFLVGDNDRGWRLPSIDWILRPQKIENLFANVYGGQAPASTAARNSTLLPGQPGWRPSPGTI